jgi:nucleotide-binding universal stress UspA family protein
MKRILVPTDFSKPAQLATDVAADIARKSGAELIMLHVVEGASEGSFNIEGETTYGGNWEDKIFTLKLIEKAKKQMSKFKDDAKYSDLKIRQELKLGSPYHGMNTIITERKVDLVVMGTSGKTELEHMIIGSNTEKVVRHAH